VAGDVDGAVGLAIVGFGVYEIAKLWQNTAPPLADLRSAHPGDLGSLQKLVDADVTVGLVTLLAAGAAFILTKNLGVALLTLCTFGVLSGYYHGVRAAVQV
jgi:hypothetical protein